MTWKVRGLLVVIAACIAALLLPARHELQPVLFAQTPGADALVGAWGFEEGSGPTTADSSGRALTGTISNATWAPTGRYGKALSFNGTNSLLTIASSPFLNLTTGMTLQAWVSPTSLSGWRSAILKERASGLAYALYAHDNAPRPAGYINVGGNDVTAPGSGALPLNTWTHLALTYNGSTLTMYVNGNVVSTRSATGSILTSSNPLRIGGNAIWGEYFSGLIDEVRIHNRALTEQEIEQLMVTPVNALPGFEILAYNPTLTLGRSDSSVYQFDLLPLGGFTSGVVPSLAGLPTGATGTFEPVGGPPHPGPFALRIATGPSVEPGTYPLVVTCVGGGVTVTKALTLIVVGDPDFRISAEPNSLIIAQGTSGSANLQVTPENGFAGSVTAGISGLPSGVSAVFEPPTLTMPPVATGTMQLTVGPSVVPGVYPVQVTATDGLVTRQTAFTLTVTQSSGTEGSWRQQALGDTPAMYYGVITGDIGNTGQNRVIASGGSGVMYAYTLNGGTWAVSQMPFNNSADGEMHNMAIGRGRNDHVNRLYIAAANSGRVYEVSWVNNAWQTQTIATLTGATDVSIAPGRNDGVQRLYITWMSGLTEMTWNGTSWTSLTMSNNEGGWVHGLDVGTGRNDGVNRVYTANQGNGQLFEYSWTGTAWTKSLIGSTSDTRNCKLGEGRNDGVMRLYAASGDANVYEYTWTGTQWTRVTMGNAGVAGVKVHAAPGRTKPDGRVRIYGAASNGGVYEYEWTGSAWQTTPMGLATAYMYGLDTGDGMNKGLGTVQVFGSSYDGNAYLYEWVPAGPPPSIPVPNVVGLTEANARSAITSALLAVGTITNQASTTVQIGRVISQSPASGTAPQGSAVNLTLSSGVAVPNVVGQTLENATAALVAASLNVDLGTLSYATSATVPQGSIVSHSPAAGARANGGSFVALVVSSGPPAPVPVPDLRGKTQAEASAALTAVGLSLGTVTNASSQTVAIGRVISSNPQETTTVPPASTVAIVLSSGFAVPDVRGSTLAQATATLQAANLVVGTVTSTPSTTVPLDSIVSQNPVPPTAVSVGSSVALVRSSGPPPPVSVPVLLGLTQAQAGATLAQAGLVLGTTANESSTTQPIGRVTRSQPPAGTPVAGGSVIAIFLSSGVVVPDVRSKTVAQATTDFAAVNLTVGVVSTATSATVPVDRIISQTPAQGTSVSPSSAVALVVSRGPSAGVAVDKTVFSDGAGTRTTPAFSTVAPGQLLLAFAASDGPWYGGQTLTVSGAGLTWTLVRRVNTRLGSSEIWRATAPTVLTNVTVSSSQSRAGYRQSLTVVSFTGASGVGASAVANGSSGAPSVTLTTTRVGSLVFGVGNDWDRAVARTLGPNQTMVHQFVDTTANDTLWVQRRNAASTAAGVSAQLNDTAPTNDRWNFASVEIIP